MRKAANMRRLILKMSMTLDGYVGGPNGEIDWIHRTLDPEATDWIEHTLWDAGAHLMGRRTYSDMIGYWPTSIEPLADPMNQIPKIVFSRSQSLDLEPTVALAISTERRQRRGLETVAPGPGWDDTLVLGADLTAEIATLKAKEGKDLLVHGGVSFAQSLVKLGLIDEYRLLIHPVVLGAGLSLFGGADPFDLELLNSTAFPSSIQAVTYRSAA
jgi:dihydrofolate reductase